MTTYFLRQDDILKIDPVPYAMYDIVVLMRADDKNQAWTKIGDNLWRQVPVPNETVLKDHEDEHLQLGNIITNVSGSQGIIAKMLKVTQEEYDAIVTKDASTLYVIV